MKENDYLLVRKKLSFLCGITNGNLLIMFWMIFFMKMKQFIYEMKKFLFNIEQFPHFFWKILLKRMDLKFATIQRTIVFLRQWKILLKNLLNFESKSFWKPQFTVRENLTSEQNANQISPIVQAQSLRKVCFTYKIDNRMLLNEKWSLPPICLDLTFAN